MLIGQQITVIGGGIAGLATALACAQRGAQVTVLEQAEAITEVGAGLQISPNGFAVLAALGLGDDLAAIAPRAQAVRLRDFRRGRDVIRLPLSGPFHLTHRADLIALLHQGATAAGVKIRLGTKVAQVTLNGPAATLHLADGTHLTPPGLTLAADGLHSSAHKALNPRARSVFTGQVAWRATLPTDSPRPPEAQVFLGPGRHLVCYPLRGGQLTNIVAVEERDIWAAPDWHSRDAAANLMAAFTDFAPEIRALLAQVEAPHIWGLFRHPVARHWHDGALALVGDAAHPTLPFLAQGANLALEDAWSLARCLAEEDSPKAAFTRYQAARRPRALQVIDAANDTATRYHLRPGPMRAAAHTALRLAGRFAPHVVANQYRWIHSHDVTA